MSRRLFIAINLPQKIKEAIKTIIENLKDDFRFPPPENWHLTITFLGYQRNEALGSIFTSIKEVSQKFQEPLIELNNLTLAPQYRQRMIWLETKETTSRNLSILKSNLEKELVQRGVNFKLEKRPFSGHITLARFQYAIDSPAIENSELSQYQHALSFTASSLDLMESHLKRSGSEYETLASFNFLKR